MSQALYLVGHGSRDRQGVAEFLGFVERVKAAAGDRMVEHGFIELAEPDVLTGLDACVARGADQILVLPIMLLAANHAKVEIPSIIAEARERHPGVTFTYGRPLGVDPLMVAALHDRFTEVEAAHGPFDRGETAFVLVGRGCSDADANSDVAKLARMVAERELLQLVDVCYTAVTFPNLHTVVRRFARLGVRRVVVQPYLLFTGVLVKLIERWVAELKAEFPEIAIHQGRYLGDHPNVPQLALIREAEALEGAAIAAPSGGVRR